MIKTIALPLFSVEEAEWLAPACCELARVLDAHVIGVHASETPMVYGLDTEALMYAELLKWYEEEGQKVKTVLDKAARAADVPCEFRLSTIELLSRENFLLSSLRSADVIVMAPASASDDHIRHQIVRQAGRPALISPQTRPLVQLPDRVLIGWSDTREAARAAYDAFSFLNPETEIDLVAVHHGHPEQRAFMDSRSDFAAAADRHGLSVTLVDYGARSGDTGQALLMAARESNADMLVTGAFGHSSLYDFVIGAVTAYLMERASLPVLLSK